MKITYVVSTVTCKLCIACEQKLFCQWLLYQLGRLPTLLLSESK